MQIILPYIESGLVWLPTESKNEDRLLPFADEFVESVSSFPNAESRDLVDTMTQALSYIRDHAHLRHPKDKYEDEIVQPRKKFYQKMSHSFTPILNWHSPFCSDIINCQV